MTLHLGESGPLDETLRRSRVPTHLHEGLVAYVGTGRPTGGFLYCVLSNDFKGVMLRADTESREYLYDLALWLMNEAPSACWGSPEKVANWTARQHEAQDACEREGAAG